IDYPAFAVVPGQLTFVDGEQPAQRLWIVAADGRVANVALGTDARAIDGDWLDAVPLDDIDTGAVLRRFGDPSNASAGIELHLVWTTGTAGAAGLGQSLRWPEQEYRSPPPVWRGLSVPKGLTARFMVSVGNDVRELPLPRR